MAELKVPVSLIGSGIVVLPLKQFEEMKFMQNHLMNSMHEELERRLAADKRLEEAKPEYYVERAKNDSWEPWVGPYDKEDSARRAAAALGSKARGCKYRVVSRLVTDWKPLACQDFKPRDGK